MIELSVTTISYASEFLHEFFFAPKLYW